MTITGEIWVTLDTAERQADRAEPDRRLRRPGRFSDSRGRPATSAQGGAFRGAEVLPSFPSQGYGVLLTDSG